jgi:4-amino-4-deoxy-L-arabinose transferase-like glycosyltransferase
VGLLLALSFATVLAGQLSLELFTMDDLREVEVAREMIETGDYVIPHLAGRPFVEKPPGFQILLALTFKASGGPSIPVARILTASFALMTLAAVYLLGRKLAGPLGGALSTVVLASSVLFCRAAHVVLLDNALAASVAWALVFAWAAFEEEDVWKKRGWYALSAFWVGISFLFKGFVGPAILGVGFLSALGATRRWKELWHAFHPLAIGAFLAPVSLWLVPFLVRAPRELLTEFFINNHLGRALHAYDSRARPFSYYFVTLWSKFLPGCVLLPFAAWTAWKERAASHGKAAIYLLALSLGGFLFLSFPKAKDHVYLLPVYPALSVLVGTWAARGLDRPGPAWPVALVFAGAALLLGLAIGFGVHVAPGWTWSGAVISLALALGVGLGIRALRKGDRQKAAVAAAAFPALTAISCCMEPISTWYVQSRDPKPALLEIARVAGDRELLLYQPDDRLRGGCGFYRGRTALEILQAGQMVERLRDHPDALAVIPYKLNEHAELAAEAARLGVTLEEERYIPGVGLNIPVSLIRTKPPRRG